MSRIDLSEFLDAYLGEVDEHLKASNEQLLALDAAMRANEPTLRSIRELFRALHTIKGLSAMVGIEPIVAIAHRMEALLRTADRAGGRVPEGAVDAMLEAVAAIEQRADALAGGRPVNPPPAALLAKLDALEEPVVLPELVSETSMRIDPAVDAKLAAFERDVMQRGVSSGLRAICARFAPSPALAARGANINTVRERLARCGEIVKVVPLSVARGEDAPAGLAFALLALTRASNTDIAGALEIDAALVTTIAEPAPPASAAAGPEESAPIADEDADETRQPRGAVRVDVAKLDEALERLSQLVISRSSLASEIDLLAARGVDVRGLSAVLREQSRQIRDLRTAILAVRMVPVAEVLDRLPLLLRGLRRTTGKQVSLTLDTGRAELDKAVAEQIFPAVVHLVRNAVDHAIEPSEERVARGKPAEGHLHVRALSRGTAQLELIIADDGRGVDVEALAARAGVPVPTSEGALIQLMCRPGLSSRDEVSTTSGRGMGMDIVRRIVVEQLRGELLLDTERGVGTSFTLRVPLTLSIIDALTFECAAQRFAVPLASVEEILEIEAANVITAPGADQGARVSVIDRRGEPVALVRMDRTLGIRGGDPERPKAMLVRRDGEAIAFAVDRMIGQQEVVVRPLEDALCRSPGIAGATDLGDGRPTLVVDLLALGAHVAEQVRAVGARR